MQNTDTNYEIYLKTDVSKYTGKWIAISDKGIVAVGTNAKEVYAEAQRKVNHKRILLVKVPTEETAIF